MMRVRSSWVPTEYGDEGMAGFLGMSKMEMSGAFCGDGFRICSEISEDVQGWSQNGGRWYLTMIVFWMMRD